MALLLFVVSSLAFLLGKFSISNKYYNFKYKALIYSFKIYNKLQWCRYL